MSGGEGRRDEWWSWLVWAERLRATTALGAASRARRRTQRVDSELATIGTENHVVLL